MNTTPVREELKCQLNELVGLTVVNSDMPKPVTVNFTRFSDWLRLLRATARVHQTAANFRSILDNIRNFKLNNRVIRFRSNYSSASTTLIPLTADLIKAAERHILQQVQIDSFPQEFNDIVNCKPLTSSSRLIKLSPSLGEDKLLHLAGRIKAAENIDPETRYPILLDGRHPVVRLLIQFYHRQKRARQSRICHKRTKTKILALKTPKYIQISGTWMSFL